MISIVACCHSAKLCAHAARNFRTQHYKAWLQNKVAPSLHSRCYEMQNSSGLTAKKSKDKLGRILDMNWIPIIVKPTECSGKPSSDPMLIYQSIVLDISKTKMMFTSAMKRTSSAVGEYFKGEYFKLRH